jgi:uncharacterized OsmC-like protein
MQIKAEYTGQLRTTVVHLKSGNKLITDAPTDNNGKGENFSPTDLVAAALGSCIITIFGIEAKKLNIELGDLKWEVTKIMKNEPRTISKIKIHFSWPNCPIEESTIAFLKEKALKCPVALCLHPDLTQEITFDF